MGVLRIRDFAAKPRRLGALIVRPDNKVLNPATQGWEDYDPAGSQIQAMTPLPWDPYVFTVELAPPIGVTGLCAVVYDLDTVGAGKTPLSLDVYSLYVDEYGDPAPIHGVFLKV